MYPWVIIYIHLNYCWIHSVVQLLDWKINHLESSPFPVKGYTVYLIFGTRSNKLSVGRDVICEWSSCVKDNNPKDAEKTICLVFVEDSASWCRPEIFFNCSHYINSCHHCTDKILSIRRKINMCIYESWILFIDFCYVCTCISLSIFLNVWTDS